MITETKMWCLRCYWSYQYVYVTLYLDGWYDTDLNTQRRTETVPCSVSPLVTPLSALHLPTLPVATHLAMVVVLHP